MTSSSTTTTMTTTTMSRLVDITLDPPKLHRFLHGYKGYLNKQGKVFKQWKNRFFVLKDMRLTCYLDDNEEEVQGEIYLDRGCQIYDLPTSVEGMKFLFYVIGPPNPAGPQSEETEQDEEEKEEVFFLSAGSEREKQDWIEAIIDQSNGGFKQIGQLDLLPTIFFPSIDLVIRYRYGVEQVEEEREVQNGNILRPSQLVSKPTISFEGSHLSAEESYILLMIDIDGTPISDGVTERGYLHWAISFNGEDVANGQELTPYLTPAPFYDSGMHRLFYLLFRHSSTPSSSSRKRDVEQELSLLYTRREGFSLQRWIDLTRVEAVPVGVNGCYVAWEEYCDHLHRLQRLLPPEPYRSPGQIQALANESEQAAIEKQKVELYRELSLKDLFPYPASWEGKGNNGKSGDDAEEKLQLYVHQPGVVPTYQVEITFETDQLVVRDGVIVAAQSITAAPRISFRSPLYPVSRDDLFTFFLVDLDSPSRIKATERATVLWMATNVSSDGDDDDEFSGDVIVSYEAPQATTDSGLHRIVGMLYSQKRRWNAEEAKQAAEYFSKRRALQPLHWVLNHDEVLLPVVVGLEAFLMDPFVVTSTQEEVIGEQNLGVAALDRREHNAEEEEREIEVLVHNLSSYVAASGAPKFTDENALPDDLHLSSSQPCEHMEQRQDTLLVALSAQGLSLRRDLPTITTVNTQEEEEVVESQAHISEHRQETTNTSKKTTVLATIEEDDAFAGAITDAEMVQLLLEEEERQQQATVGGKTGKKDLHINTSTGNMSEVDIPYLSDSSSDSEPKPVLPKRKALQRNPSVHMGNATQTFQPALGPAAAAAPVALEGATSSREIDKAQFAKSMDGLDDLLSMGYSSVQNGDHHDNFDDDHHDPPFPPAVSPASVKSRAQEALTMEDEPPAPIEKDSLVNTQSSLAVPVATSSSSDASNNKFSVMKSPIRRLLSSTPSMYFKHHGSTGSEGTGGPSEEVAAAHCATFLIQSPSVFQGGNNLLFFIYDYFCY